MSLLAAVRAPAARARCASKLITLARAGYVEDAELRALGRALLAAT